MIADAIARAILGLVVFFCVITAVVTTAVIFGGGWIYNHVQVSIK